MTIYAHFEGTFHGATCEDLQEARRRLGRLVGVTLEWDEVDDECGEDE